MVSSPINALIQIAVHNPQKFHEMITEGLKSQMEAERERLEREELTSPRYILEVDISPELADEIRAMQ